MAQHLWSYLTPSELQRLEQMTLQSRYVVEGTLAGRHRSPLRGASTEFADHRAYIAGDDPGRLDWKVLARTDRYYIRRYEDETVLRVYLVVDGSASMAFGTTGRTKYEEACRLAAALGYVTVKARDAVGLYLYSEGIRAAFPARNTLLHLNEALGALRRHTPSSETRTADTLHRIAASVRRRALVILFSDLLDDEDAVMRGLAHFRRQHHDVILFHVLDPAELDFSFERGGRFVDMETEQALVADPRSHAAAYRDVFRAFLDTYRQRCAELRIDYRLADTRREVGPYVRAYLQERKRLAR
jgi:uncharacterized protein (DUF58 family)